MCFLLCLKNEQRDNYEISVENNYRISRYRSGIISEKINFRILYYIIYIRVIQYFITIYILSCKKNVLCFVYEFEPYSLDISGALNRHVEIQKYLKSAIIFAI